MADYSNENSYRTILKRISAFGGVQVLNILVNLVRGKLVALFLGPEGMGISSLFNTASNTIKQLSGLGLDRAIVREIANDRDKPDSMGLIMHIINRLILATSLLGCIACALLAPLLSKFTFGNYDYTWGFVLLGLAVGLSVGAAGYSAILQGLSEVKRLSKSTLVGSLAGLCFCVPLYWKFGIAGIVPSIIVLSLCIFLFYYISYRRSQRGVVYSKPDLSQAKPLIKKLVVLGLILMAGSFASSLTSYAINACVRAMGTVEDIGLFQAANSITIQYVGVLFSALCLDYFPRLSAIADDKVKLNEVVNRQTDIMMLGLTPLILILMLTTPYVIRILLTEEFLVIDPLIKCMSLGFLLQGITYPLGYIIVAKNDKKAYVWLEIVLGNVLWLLFSTWFFYLFELIGLGISLAVRTFLDVFISYIFCRLRYGIHYTGSLVREMLLSSVLTAIGFCLAMCENNAAKIALGGICCISVCYSVVKMRKRLKSE